MSILRWVLLSIALLSTTLAAHSRPAPAVVAEAASAVLATSPVSAAVSADAASKPDADASPKDPLAASLKALTDSLSSYLLALAGTSALVVALLEAYKKLFSVRGKYHRTAVMRWLAQDAESIKGTLSLAKPGVLSAVALGGGEHYAVREDRAAHVTETGKSYDAEQAYAEFFHLTSGQTIPPKPNPSHAVVRWRGVDRAVFELETSRMMSQIQDAADAVLNNPALYPNLYAFFTRGANGNDSSEWFKYITTPLAGSPTKEHADRYGRVKMLMKRQLDAFQTVTTCRWEDLNQWWAMVAGAVLLFIALIVGADPKFEAAAFDPWRSLLAGWANISPNFFTGEKDKAPLFGLLLKAALGGVLAPLAKDILKSISTIKFSK